MNKTFTAAIAITAVAGLASAAIETAPAGYVDRDAGGSQILVSNPFNSFENGATTTLGDIDGENIGNGKCIALVAANGHLTKLYWQGSATPPGWYDAQTGGTCYNSTALARGDGILFNGASECPLVFSGPIATEIVPAKSAVNGGYKVVGNASPVDTTLSAFSIGGTGYDYAKDYVTLRDTKYVYKNGHWFAREDGADADAVDVYAGEGLFLFCQRRRGGTFNATIVVPAN